MSNFDVDQFLAYVTILPCTCDEFPFVDKYHDHSLTGHLRTIEKAQSIKNTKPSILVRRRRALYVAEMRILQNENISEKFLSEWRYLVTESKISVKNYIRHL